MKKVLMVAYHYPPFSGSSGIQRTLRFSTDLTSFGWMPSVLSANPRAFESTSDDLVREVPSTIDVRYAFALDARRHLSICNRYPAWIARPDRWSSWLLGALTTGLRMIRMHRPNVIWSTYPIATAHLVGYWLSRITSVPWVADFRDPMAHPGYPADQATWDSYLAVEQKVFAQASHMVFTTPGAAHLYQERYPDRAGDIRVIENGYDEKSFESVDDGSSTVPLNPGMTTLLHSGVVYPQWRNPQALFAAVRALINSQQIDPARLRLRFRAPGNLGFLMPLVSRHGLEDLIQILPPVGYLEALRELQRADALLVLQSADCGDQIPAKVYEYFRAHKPVLGLCGEQGDTWELMHRAGHRHFAPLESPQHVQATLVAFLDGLGRSELPGSKPGFVAAASRHSRAAELALVLDETT